MARTHHVKKAQKDYPDQGIAKGDQYWWWKFRYGGKVRSAKPPRRSQLTQSAFLGQVYDLEDSIGGVDVDTFEDLSNALEGFADEAEQLGEQAQESLDAMPEHLQDTSSSGELLTERIEQCEQWAEELRGVTCEFDETAEENEKEQVQGLFDDEVCSIGYEGS